MLLFFFLNFKIDLNNNYVSSIVVEIETMTIKQVLWTSFYRQISNNETIKYKRIYKEVEKKDIGRQPLVLLNWEDQSRKCWHTDIK